jgi:H+/Cl- antiporter ClcA
MSSSTPQSEAQPEIEGRDYLRLIGLGALIGIPAALVAIAFLALVHGLEHVLWVSWPEAMGLGAPPLWMVLVLPVVGGVLVWLASTFLPGHGGHEPLQGISLAPTPISYAPSVALAALASLAFGAVLGPEAPLIALGSIVGLIAARWAKVAGKGVQVASTAGAISSISALFGGPIVAGVMVVEAGIALGSALIPAILPGLVAGAIGYTVIVGFGAWSGIPVASLSVPDLPPYSTTRVVDLLLAVVIGVITAGIVVPLVRQVARRVAGARDRIGLGPVVVLAGLVVGLLAVSVNALGGTYDDVLFSGQSSIPALLASDQKESVLLVVVLAKALAYAVCLGGGFRGGPVFPAIFIGTAVAVLVGGPFGLSTTAALAIGAACGMTAFTRLVITSLVLALLLTGTNGAGAVPAAVLAAVAAWVVTQVIERRSTTPAPE